MKQEIIKTKGYLPQAIFSDEELGKVLARDYYRSLWIDREYRVWRSSKKEKPEIPEQEALMLRARHLKNRFEELIRMYYRTRKRHYKEQAEKMKREYVLLTTQPKGQLTEQEIERARNRNVSEFIEVNRVGFAQCPFHNEKTPSLKVTGNVFYCFGCHESGDVIKFFMKYYNVGFREAVSKML